MTTLTCTINGCEKLVYIIKSGWCSMHYARWRKYGDASYAVKAYRMSTVKCDAERFSSLTRVMPNGCHEWQGRILNDGYGGFRTMRAHRWAWEEANGRIPDRIVVRHKCDNPPCVNIDHLELGSLQDNADDKVKRGRSLIGSKNPIAKLDESKVVEIKKALRDMASTQRDLALKYGISQKVISAINTGRAWKHVTLEAA